MDIIIPLYICFDVFAGGGVALLHASKVLSMFKPKNTYQQIGVEILQNALEVSVFFFPFSLTSIKFVSSLIVVHRTVQFSLSLI